MIRLADSLIIPFDLLAMSDYIESQVTATINQYGAVLPEDKLGKTLMNALYSGTVRYSTIGCWESIVGLYAMH